MIVRVMMRLALGLALGLTLAPLAVSGAARKSHLHHHPQVRITWSTWQSHLYPYSIKQPSSLSHVVLSDATGHPADYFFPALGSFTTSVNISATPGRKVPSEVAFLRSIGAHRVWKGGWLRIAGKRRHLVAAEFRGLAGRWNIEQAGFLAEGRIWRLTASYDVRYRRLLPLMLRMLHSFRLRPSPRH